jgi:hypothetical protein
MTSVSITVTNSGDVSSEYTAILKVSGTKAATQTIDIPGNSSAEISFSILKTTPGVYTIDINGLTGSLNITSSVASTTPTATTEPVVTTPIVTTTPADVIATTTPAVTLPTGTTPPVSDDDSGMKLNWWLIGGIAAAAVVIIVFLLAFTRRHD